MAVPDYLQDFVTDFAQQAKTAYSAPLDPKTFMGPQFVAGLDPVTNTSDRNCTTRCR